MPKFDKNQNVMMKFLTITYAEHSSTRPEVQFMDTIVKVTRALNKVSDNYQLAVELTECSNVHYHVIINIKEGNYNKERSHLEQYIATTLPYLKRNCGFIHNVTIRNLERCKEYIYKDRDMMEKILKVKLPLTDTPNMNELRSKHIGNTDSIPPLKPSTWDNYDLVIKASE